MAAGARYLIGGGKGGAEVQHVPQQNLGLFKGICRLFRRHNGGKCCFVNELLVIVMTHNLDVIHGELRGGVHNGVGGGGHAAGAQHIVHLCHVHQLAAYVVILLQGEGASGSLHISAQFAECQEVDKAVVVGILAVAGSTLLLQYHVGHLFCCFTVNRYGYVRLMPGGEYGNGYNAGCCNGYRSRCHTINVRGYFLVHI